MSVEGSDSSVPILNDFLAEGLSLSAWEPSGGSGGKEMRDRLEQVGVSRDDLFKLLSNPRRRYVLYYLTQHATEVELGTLATQIAAWENQIQESEVSGMERKRVYTSLQQVHLPKMDDSGVLAFDKRSGTITLKVSLTELELGEDMHDEFPWYRYHAALSVGNAIFAVLTVLNIWPFAVVSDLLVLAWILISYAFLTVVHTAVSTNSEWVTRLL
jgi:hypothetical protein